MNIIKSKTNPQAWNEKYDINDFSDTICYDGCSIKWRMKPEQKKYQDNPLWIEVGFCIASNFEWRTETNAPKSKVKVELDLPAETEYVEYANIIVIDNYDKPNLIINTLTGESIEY